MEPNLILLIERIKKTLEECNQSRTHWDKDDKSPVTVTDIAIQIVFNQWVKNHYPDDTIVAEESSKDLNSSISLKVHSVIEAILPNEEKDIRHEMFLLDYTGSQKSEFVWYLDPIDGTKGYLRNEQFAVAVSRWHKSGYTDFAVLICPNLPFPDLKNSQNKGTIFFLDNNGNLNQFNYNALSDCRKLTIGKMNNLVIAKSVEKAHGNTDAVSHLKNEIENSSFIEMDSQAKYGILFRNEANLYLRYPSRPDYREKWWDHAAGLAMVKALGGAATDIDGNIRSVKVGERQFSDGNGVVVSFGLDHSEIISALKKFKGDGL